jgi:acetoin utilization protein AcuB
MPVTEARTFMDKREVHHLPVLDKNNTLIGIVTKEDLIKAGPSPATSLDMYEISYLLSKLKVETVMSRDVVTVDENEVVEEAARIMADKGVGCLPVMRGPLLVGIITDTDLFRVFVNAFGARHGGVRVTFNMNERPGQLAKLTHALAEKGGNLVAFVSSEGDDMTHRRGTLKITGLSKAEVEAITRSVPDVEIEDLRE